MGHEWVNSNQCGHSRLSFVIFGTVIASPARRSVIIRSPGVEFPAPTTPTHTEQAGTVTLPTGEPIIVDTGADGRTRAQLADRSGGQPYLTRRDGGDDYVIPLSAVRYLGRGPDPGLFDVSAPRVLQPCRRTDPGLLG